MTNSPDVSDVEEDVLLKSILHNKSLAFEASDDSQSDSDEEDNSAVQEDGNESTDESIIYGTQGIANESDSSELQQCDEAESGEEDENVLKEDAAEDTETPVGLKSAADVGESDGEENPVLEDSSEHQTSDAFESGSDSDEEDDLHQSMMEQEADDAADEPEPTAPAEIESNSYEDSILEEETVELKEPETNEIESKSKTSSKDRKRKMNNSIDDDWFRTEKEEQLMQTVFGNKDKLIAKLSEDYTNNVVTVSKTRQAVWHDSDDEGLHADDVIDYEKKGAPPVRKQGKYKVYLEQTFQNVLGTPAWANLDRIVEDEDSDDEQLLRTVGHLAKPVESARLLPTTIQFKRMKDLNRASYAEGPAITGLEFHPTSSVALVTGKSGIATIYSIDGRKNEKLHGLQFDNYSIKSCRITRSGNEAIVGGSKKFFYTYNLMTGDSQRTFLPKNITKMSNFELSPDGRLISVSGRFGEIHLLNANSKELVSTVKQEHQCTSMTFSTDSNYLLAHSTDAEVSIFDIRANKVMHRFNDEGCVNGSSIKLSPNGRLLATGSEQGVVNVYDFEQVTRSSNPKPEKTIFNLTTGITSTEFNHSSEILAIGSKHINDAIKLVHFPTGTVYANFPGPQGGIGKPNIVRFSPMSGYLAIGNLGKEVTLYRLKHFGNY